VKYLVWIGGVIHDEYDTLLEATDSVDEWTELGYDDVIRARKEEE